MKVWLPTVRAGSGSDVYVQRLSRALASRGIDAPITWLPGAFELAPMLARATPPAGTRVIHANSWTAFAFARFGLPLAATCHSPIHGEAARGGRGFAQGVYHDTLVRAYERRSFARASAVVAVSQAVAAGIAAIAPATRPVVIHNWVDTDTFRPAPAGARAPGPFRLLFAGNRTRWKGWDLLAPLMRQLGDRFELLLATGLRGDRVPLPPHARSLGKQAGEAAMARAYHACDAVLVPSRLEGFGYVAAEAMACGKPVLGFRAGALPEVVADGSTGLLAPAGDVEALADACRRLAVDAALAARLGEAGRARAVEHFGEAAAMERYLALYAALPQAAP